MMATRKMKADRTEFTLRCGELGLDPSQIDFHRQRILASFDSGSNQYIPVADTCRIENGGILRLQTIGTLPKNLAGVASFIPAAGASSRYIQVFDTLLQAAKNRDRAAVEQARLQLQAKSLHLAVIPEYLQELISGKIGSSFADLDKIVALILQPKAFFPCVKDGKSFLDAKIKEDEALGFSNGLVFVASPSAYTEFRSKLETLPTAMTSLVIEQGANQSTIRFDATGEPIRDSDGKFSLVPAGHGTLASCLPSVGQFLEGTHSVLIRNIDNVMGSSPAIIESVHAIVSLHNYLLKEIVEIRRLISDQQWAEADRVASAVYVALNLQAWKLTGLTSADLAIPDDCSALWRLQRDLFHCHADMVKSILAAPMDRSTLQRLYQRPINTLGQVPNTNKDVGGTPAFVKQGSSIYKICLEVPHAAPDDRTKFLEDAKYATHFNPVFALAEIDFDPDYYSNAEHGTWLLAKKNFLGQTVYYHESVLYELLGNSILANVVFLEIPRILFNPHKTIDDASGRLWSDWFRNS